MRNLKVKQQSGWQFIEHKKAPKNVPYIGFEWEVYGLWYDNFYETEQARRVLNSGFRFHNEHGTEFASPVANTISQARNAAKYIIKQVKNSKLHCLPDQANHQSGIHVTVSPRHEQTKGEMRAVYYSLVAPLNHSSFKDFLWKFSGRDSRDLYGMQAVSYCWDVTPKPYAPYDMHFSMVKLQSNRGNGAYEFRIWSGKTHRLIPALEFAHSYYRFITGDKNRIKTTDEYLYCVIPQKFKDKSKTFDQYCEWLFKQDGYFTLKKDEAFNI